MRPGKRMHSLSPDKPRSEPLIRFYLLDTLVLQFPGCQRPCADTLSRRRARSDRQGQLIRAPRAPRPGGRGNANRITVVHNMQGVLKCLTRCQKVPGFVSGTNRAWQGSDSLAGADRTRQVQRDTFLLPRMHCRPLSYSLPSHLRLSSQVVPCVCVGVYFLVFFIHYLSLLICCFSGAMLPARRDNIITTDPSSCHSSGRQETLGGVFSERCTGCG